MKGSSGVRTIDESVGRLKTGNLNEWGIQSSKLFANYIATKDQEDLWTLVKKNKDLSVESYYAENTKCFMAKEISKFSSSPESVMGFYSKIANRPLFETWQEEVNEFYTEKDSVFDVSFSVLQMLQTFSSYEVVLFTMKFHVGEVLYMVAHSINHPDIPEEQSSIREKVEFLIKEARPNPKGEGTLFTQMIRIDPDQHLDPEQKQRVLEQAGLELFSVIGALESNIN